MRDAEPPAPVHYRIVRYHGPTAPITMIISYQHQFIFLHCRKVAGSAMQIHLARHLGPDDILLGTREDLDKHGIRQTRRFRRDVFSPTGLAFLGKRALRKPAVIAPGRLRDTLARVHKDVYNRRLSPYAGHAPATHVRDFDPEAWDRFYKFCFVRNPYERALSDYFWRIKARDRDLTFHEFLQHIRDQRHTEPPESPRHDNWPIYTIDDAIAVDHVGRYENLATDFANICERIGIPAEGLPVAKKVMQKYDYHDYYGPAERSLVEQIYERELAVFDYRF